MKFSEVWTLAFLASSTVLPILTVVMQGEPAIDAAARTMVDAWGNFLGALLYYGVYNLISRWRRKK